MTPHPLPDFLLSNQTGNRTTSLRCLHPSPSPAPLRHQRHRRQLAHLGSTSQSTSAPARLHPEPIRLAARVSLPYMVCSTLWVHDFVAHSKLPERTHSRIYSPEFMLSLRPNADESVKEKMREALPEVVMNRRTRKNLEFSQHQREAAERKAHHQPSSPAAAVTASQAPFSPSTAPSTVPPRMIPRRNRPAGRATERRRQALQSNFNLHDTWRGRVATPLQPLAVV